MWAAFNNSHISLESCVNFLPSKPNNHPGLSQGFLPWSVASEWP
jgi:hypothetical protein